MALLCSRRRRTSRVKTASGLLIFWRIVYVNLENGSLRDSFEFDLEARQLLDSIDVSTGRRPTRSGADRAHGVQLRARGRSPRHAGRGRLRPAAPPLGAAAREGQALCDALSPHTGRGAARLPRRMRVRSRAERAAVPHHRAGDQKAGRDTARAGARPRHDPMPRSSGGDRHPDRQSHFSGRPASPPTSRTAGSWRRPRPWPTTAPRARRSFTNAGATRSVSTRSSERESEPRVHGRLWWGPLRGGVAGPQPTSAFRRDAGDGYRIPSRTFTSKQDF